MNPTLPRITVVIPAYNQAQYLREAIASVLANTFTDFEIIVVDDGSVDNTADVVRGFDDGRIRYIYQANRGLSAARNTGIQRAVGEYITYLDSDDQFLPEKLEILQAELTADTSLGLVAGQAELIDEHGESLAHTFTRELPAEGSQLLLGNPLHVGSVLVRRTWQDKAGLFDETLRSYEDWDMWLRLALLGCPMRFVAKPVSRYRFHTAQMTRNGRQMTEASFSVLNKIFGTPNLPQTWSDLKSKAYSRSHLRAAANAYVVKDYEQGSDHLRRAVELDPSLLDGEAAALANHLSALTDHPKVHDRLAMLTGIYFHLPSALKVLKRRRRSDLGSFALAEAFRSFAAGEKTTARRAVLYALDLTPGAVLSNRGALSILIQTLRSTPSPIH